MASNAWSPLSPVSGSDEGVQHRPRSRAIPVRIRTYSKATPQETANDNGWSPPLQRQRSAQDTSAPSPSQRSFSPNLAAFPTGEAEIAQVSSHDTTLGSSLTDTISTPPTSPLTRVSTDRTSIDSLREPDFLHFDFSKIDYELERAKALGEGLWSTVYLAEQKRANFAAFAEKSLTPPPTPERHLKGAAPSVYAIKLPSRRDANAVLQHEARVLTRLQRSSCSAQYVVPFWGLDDRNDALVFEAVIGGSLEDLIRRLKHMTEVSRHLKLISIFPGIAYDLVSGLSFLHDSGLVHADIKPGNILLDISEHISQPQLVIRARYIDFSASFFPTVTPSDDPSSSLSSVPAGGGTWDYMAPEQLRVQRDLSTPTPASDVWSLGITLLTVLAGESPYAALSGGGGSNAVQGAALYRLRDAVKAGDPLAWVRGEPVPRKRLAACQDFVDCCRLALKKDRENRVAAPAWLAWLEGQQMAL